MGGTPRVLRWLAGMALVSAAGCSDRDADRIGHVSNKAFDRATALTRQAGQRIGLSLGNKGNGVESLELSGRVSYRLKWDQVLEGASIKVDAEKGTVSLTGVVRDDVQRRRAVDLAQATVGVEQVHEALETAAQGK